ncbi:MAG TPA: Fic family protein [Candidatus Elarobacter sp.]|jgi:Fic family protein
MNIPRSAKTQPESASRIEPTSLEIVSAPIADVVAELSAESAALGRALHPSTAASLAQLVRIMNAYYSNLIEGHNTRPRDIERALAGQLDKDEGRRNLQLEAAAHVAVQADVDGLAASGGLPEPASTQFIQWLHREFYRDAPPAMLSVRSGNREYIMRPGEWRSSPSEDVVVGRHQPPSSARVVDFMRYFEERFRLDQMGKAARIIAVAIAHHRFNYIHPFPDGNGRVSRLMSHAMGHAAGIGAHGLWSVSRGLARGLENPAEYKMMMDMADAPRENDFDGRGNLSQRALSEFVLWFLRVCLDQVRFMAELFDLNTLARRLRVVAERDDRLRPEAGKLLEAAATRGEIERGEAARITGLPERTARRVLNDMIGVGLLASDTPKGLVSVRFPPALAEALFPRLFTTQ